MRVRPGAVQWREFGAGAAAGTAATIVQFALRGVIGPPTPDEALTEWLVGRLPFPVFAWLLATLQHAAKPLGFSLTVAVTLLVCGVGGVAFGWACRACRPSWRVGAAVVAGAAVVGSAIVPLLGAPSMPGLSPVVSLAVGVLVYGLLLECWIPRITVRASAGASAESRAAPSLAPRGLSRRTALLGSGLLAAAWLVRRITGVPPDARRAPVEVTPNDRFYQISKNYPLDPTVDPATWSLDISGLVRVPLTLSYAAFLNAAPAVERYHTLECISNEVGGDLIGNAKWRGIRVRDVLALAGVRATATTVVWRTADGYRESVPLDVAMDPDSLLAYEMNGVALPQKHGAPVRVLLPNRYGMKQPKWLTAIEVARLDIMGYWERQGLSKAAIVKTQSAFFEAAPGPLVTLGGWAFAGRRGISRVQISGDGGTSWISASLRAPLGANCWQFWTAAWRAPAPGEYTLTVRAADGTGVYQPGRFRRLPDGAEGDDAVRVRVPG